MKTTEPNSPKPCIRLDGELCSMGPPPEGLNQIPMRLDFRIQTPQLGQVCNDDMLSEPQSVVMASSHTETSRVRCCPDPTPIPFVRCSHTHSPAPPPPPQCSHHPVNLAPQVHLPATPSLPTAASSRCRGSVVGPGTKAEEGRRSGVLLQ